MDEVEVNVVELELLEGETEGTFDVVLVSLPQLGGDSEFLALETGCKDLLKGLTDCLLILVDGGGVDVAVTVVEDGLADDGLAVTLG